MPEESIPEPWWDLRTGGSIKAKHRDALRTELNRERCAGHTLYGHGYSIIARSQARDDVLIALDDNT